MNIVFPCLAAFGVLITQPALLPSDPLPRDLQIPPVKPVAGPVTHAAGSGANPNSQPEIVWVPGGLEALAVVAGVNPKTSRDRFYVDYCRAIVQNSVILDRKSVETYLASIRDHFQRLAELSTSRASTGDGVRLTVSLQDKHAQKESERILGLLGWKIKVSTDGIKIEAGENLALARRQETASALAIDEVGMREALKARKTFTFEIPYESAPIILNEKTWKAEFYQNQHLPGGFAEALARDPRIARLYVGLSALDEKTADSLVSSIGLKALAERYAELLFLYASSLASSADGVVVPGGRLAEPVWANLAGVSPRAPGRFFRALLDKDGGRLLSFYSAVAELDAAHQRFCTLSAARTQKFYDLFRQAPEMKLGTDRIAFGRSFAEFFRELQLDPEGHVRWPGSADVWSIANGASPFGDAMHRLPRKLGNTASPEVEDEILVRLARNRYRIEERPRSELDNLVAINRVDRHRSEPLDERSALMLAQHYAEYGAVYPYFASLNGLKAEDYQQFFRFGKAARRLNSLRLNSVLGEWHAVTEILCLIQQAGAIDSSQAAPLFRVNTERFTNALSAPDLRAHLVATSLDSLRAILKAADPVATGLTPDEAIQDLLAGNSPPVASVVNGTTRHIDFSKRRRDSFARVLELQKVTKLEPLYRIYDSAQMLAASRQPAESAVRTIEESLAGLLTVEVPKALKAKGKANKQLLSFRADSLADLTRKLRQSAAKGSLNPKDRVRLCQEIIAELEPQVRWTLTGLVYAAYLSPEDLLVSDDPLFVRKHQYLPLPRVGSIWAESDLAKWGDERGSCIRGGFAGFAATAGRVATMSRTSGSWSEAVAATQYAAIRAADCRRLRDEDLRLFALTVRAGREWIVQSAMTPELREGLAESTLGLLSLSRRSNLLNAITAADWKTVSDAVTLSDLYFLGRQYLARYDHDLWTSPIIVSLRHAAASNDGSRLDVLGAAHSESYGCGHPHVMEQPPYEGFERYISPARLAERVAELKFYIADRMGAAGLPAAAFGAIAGPVAQEVLKEIPVSDVQDWQSVLSVFARLDSSRIREIVAQQ